MPKRLSNIQKEEIIKGFKIGKTIQELSDEFGCTKLTITRNLKKKFGEDEYTNLLNKKNKDIEGNVNESYFSNNDQSISCSLNENFHQESLNESIDENIFPQQISFTEIVPLDFNIDNQSRKDFSSIPINEIEFPKTVFMIVDKKIELEVKPLKEYPEWQFLPEEDLNKKTIQIFSDIKDAKRSCNKDQKVIKIPNPNVFKIASKTMLSKGISRIVSDKQLIAL